MTRPLLLAGGLGNLYLDRWWAGGARDFLLTPWFVANLADVYVGVPLVAVGVECVVYPPARRLLRLTGPRQIWQETCFFFRWLAQEGRRWRTKAP